MMKMKRRQLRWEGQRQEVTLNCSNKQEPQPISSRLRLEERWLKIHPLLKAPPPHLQPIKPRPLHPSTQLPHLLRYDITAWWCTVLWCTHNPPVTHMDQLAVTHDALFFFLSLISRMKSQRTKMDPNMSSPSAGLTRSETSITSITSVNGSFF